MVRGLMPDNSTADPGSASILEASSWAMLGSFLAIRRRNANPLRRESPFQFREFPRRMFASSVRVSVAVVIVSSLSRAAHRDLVKTT
jgi:hypothetical protein